MSALKIVEPVAYTLLSGHPASAYQAAVFNAVADPRSGSKIIEAVAGAGKTTVIKNALRYLPSGLHVQGFAFNTDAAKNLKLALAEVVERDGPERYKNVRMGTFHSVGYAALLRFLDKKADQVKPDGGKCRRLLKARVTEEEYETYGAYATKLVGLAKGEGVGALVPDTEERWWGLVEHHGLYLDSEEASEARGVDIARKLLDLSSRVAKTGDIDYDDMLYLVCLWKLRLWQNDVVFTDESQDTNPVRRAMARLALKAGGRLFAVGDPRQSIYGFTGASTDAMDIIAREFNCAKLPLTVSYRCAKAVVAQAREWVSYVEPAPAAPEGEVRHEVPLKEALGLLTDADAILCRQTAPLVDLAYKLIAAGRGCRILGKEIGEGLINLIRAQKARGVDRLVEKLEAFRDREVARFIARGDENRAEAVADRVACVLTVIDALPDRTVPALERRIAEVFRLGKREDEKIELLTLATVHKAKGQEWERVAILRPDLMPSKAARQEWQIEQEVNLQYVAATRAKLALLYLTPAEENVRCHR